MLPSSDRQNQAVQQLVDMFDISLDRARSICEQNDWDINACIDQIIISQPQAGAIPKNSNKTNHDTPQLLEPSIASYAGALLQRSNPKTSTTAAYNKSKIPNNNSPIPSELKNIIENIRSRNRIMIILRGPPGCGKSYLAKEILKYSTTNLEPYTNRDFILSSDDYFYDAFGRYNYNPALLDAAHSSNHRRAREKATSGWSPIIIDNTNLKLWEMGEYVHIAVENGYVIEFLEPKTSWRNSAGKLASKNTHNVPKEKIQRMLKNYEKGTVKDVLTMLNIKRVIPVPQKCLLPILNMSEEPLPRPNSISKVDAISSGVSQHTYDPYNTPDTTKKSNAQQEKYDNSYIETSWDAYNPPLEPKQQRTIFRLPNSKEIDVNQQQKPEEETVNDEVATTNSFRNSYATNDTDWILNKEEEEDPYSDIFIPHSDLKRKNPELPEPSKNLLEMLKESAMGSSVSSSPPNVENVFDPTVMAPLKKHSKFERHSANCANEDESFKALRQIYSQADVSQLWDLYVKCDGNADWAADLLLKEDDSGTIVGSSEQSFGIGFCAVDSYKCNCDGKGKKLKKTKPTNEQNDDNVLQNRIVEDDCLGSSNTIPSTATRGGQMFSKIGNNYLPKPLPQRPRTSRQNRTSTAFPPPPDIQDLKNTIENRIAVKSEYYSDQLTKIRNLRHGIRQEVVNTIGIQTDFEYVDGGDGIVDNDLQSYKIPETDDLFDTWLRTPLQTQQSNSDITLNEFTINEYNSVNDGIAESEEMIEMPIGEQLVSQLYEIFGNEFSSIIDYTEMVKKRPIQVFMPRSLAKELYMLCVEAVYNQCEEERKQMIQADENFACLLKNPKYENFKESPANVTELLDMEMAWWIYENEQKEMAEEQEKRKPQTMAAHLSYIKLQENFPHIPSDTLLDLLRAHGNSYAETEEVLRYSINAEGSDKESYEIEQILQLSQSPSLDPSDTRNEDDSTTNCTTSSNNTGSTTPSNDVKKQNIPTSVARRRALLDFEENRNLAAHHCQIKAECFRKAKEAIQRSEGEVALYYSQVANFHKNRVEQYNQRAANCMMEVQEYSKNNPDLLDLHYLHVSEAICCLDIFLDRHINKMITSRNAHKNVFIITGRGLHSASGISAIKNKVKIRLKERALKWVEVNPGLLRVKLFQTSRFTKNM